MGCECPTTNKSGHRRFPKVGDETREGPHGALGQGEDLGEKGTLHSLPVGSQKPPLRPHPAPRRPRAGTALPMREAASSFLSLVRTGSGTNSHASRPV